MPNDKLAQWLVNDGVGGCHCNKHLEAMAAQGDRRSEKSHIGKCFDTIHVPVHRQNDLLHQLMQQEVFKRWCASSGAEVNENTLLLKIFRSSL